MKPPLTRVCKKCGEEKPLEEFVKCSKRKYSRTHNCKVCDRIHKTKWRNDNIERCRELRRQYRKDNPEKFSAEFYKQYRKDNPGKNKAASAKYRKDNPEKKRLAWEKYHKDNPEMMMRLSAKAFLSRKIGIPTAELPEELIQYKILQYKLHRKIKEHETS